MDVYGNGDMTLDRRPGHILEAEVIGYEHWAGRIPRKQLW